VDAKLLEQYLFYAENSIQGIASAGFNL